MAFWGCEVKPGSKPTPFVPPPTEGGHAPRLHLSQACLSTKAKPGTKAALRVRVSEEGEPLLVCVLREGGTESIGLDLIFDQYTEFSVEGGAAIHLTGYYMPEFETGEDDSDEEGGFPPGQLLGYDEYGMPVLADQYDSDEDSDYETEDSDDDEEMGSEDEDGDLNPPRRVVIEDVTDAEGQKLKALPAPQQANGKLAAAEQEGSDEDGEDDDDDDDDEEEEEESAEEESEEEPAQQVAAKQQQKQQQAAGQKRKADQQPAAQQPAKKEAKQQGAPATPAGKQQGAAAAAAAEKQHKQQQQQQSSQQKQQLKDKEATGKPAAKSKVRTFPNGFEIEDLKQGRPDGKLAKAGKKVLMRYVGRLKSNGKVFDETKGKATFSFRLGVGEVIKGWDRGVEGMRVGDKRRLTIPPQMAYGSSGVRGAIPPNAWLVFDVELVDVK